MSALTTVFGRLLPGRQEPQVEAKILRALDVSQVGDELTLRIALSSSVSLVAMWARTGDGELIALPQPQPVTGGSGGVVGVVGSSAPDSARGSACGAGRADGTEGVTHYEARIDLLTLLPAEPLDDGGRLLLSVEVEQEVDAGRALTLKDSMFAYAHIETQPDETLVARYHVPLGRAADTWMEGLAPLLEDGREVSVHVTRRGYLAVELDHELKAFGDVKVRWLSTRAGQVRFQGALLTRHGEVERAQLVLRGRLTGLLKTWPVTLNPDDETARRTFGLRRYDYDVRGDWRDLLSAEHVDNDIVDAWMRVWTKQSGQPFDVRIGRTRFAARRLSHATWVGQGDRTVAITPFYTFKARKTSFHIEVFDTETFKYLRRQVRQRWLLRARYQGKPVWLVGERPDKAQDTGYHFFAHLRKHHPEVDAFYVMDPAAPDYRNVEPLGNVLAHRSKEHVRAALLAERVVSSHHADFLYPVRTPRFGRAMRATKVFLQHGVMGTKWMVPNYGRHIADFDADLFVVSSEREKEYIVEDFDYDPKDVVVTGLSRFDALLTPDVPAHERQLLIMPTWRDWLQDPDTYVESDYYQRWSEVLHHPRLRALAEQHGLEVVFCLHPNMQQFTPLFADAPARVVSQGEVDVQHLLKESAMLVTDYSSVGFDFSFLHKPVAYYQFDRPRFLGREGSHLDLDLELPGPIVLSVEAVLDEIAQRLEAGFAMEPEYAARADRFISHRDRQSSERIYQQARTARRARFSLRNFFRQETSVAIFNRFRRSGWYFSIMKAFFRLVKLLPADDRLIVFESGTGRQYADSPRYIYEELLRRGGDWKLVWAYSGRIRADSSGKDNARTDGPRTKVVKRLSPSYYLYLARARYWVNNQNFPYYITRRRNGVYVQTWHGTPLKRMLHDLDEIHGRDGGYLARVTAATQQWSSLVSPSPFATNVMRSAFRYNGNVIEQGNPRNDVFFGPDRDALAAMVRHRLGIADGKTVVLYAPTFRDNQARGDRRYAFTLPFDLDRFHEELGDDVVLLLRMHALVRDKIEIPEQLAHHVINVSDHPEIQELYLASDALVTDYSSVFFDFANLRRPMVFYAHDLESYRDQLRGFYLDYERDVPGPVTTTQDQLYAALRELPAVTRDYGGRYDAFLARFSPHEDGHSAARVVDLVFGK